MVGGILVIHPVVFSIYLYEAQDNQVPWLAKLEQAYSIILSFQDGEQLFTGILFGLLGIAFILKMIVGNNKLQIMVAMQNRNRIINLIQKGKSPYVDFQPALLWDLEQKTPHEGQALVVAKIMAGLMNTHGGHLFIGVSEEGKLLGLEEDYQALKKLGWHSPPADNALRKLPLWESFLQYIMHLIANILDASHCSLVKVDFCSIEGKDICHIQVKRSASPVYVHINERAHFFIRSGKATRELDVMETLEYIENLLK